MANTEYFMNSILQNTNSHSSETEISDFRRQSFVFKESKSSSQQLNSFTNILTDQKDQNPQIYEGLKHISEKKGQNFVTDRFIPQRKALKQNYIFDAEDEQNQQVYDKEPSYSQPQISDLYKKYVVVNPSSQYGKQEQNTAPNVFKNKNILTYNKNTKNQIQWEVNQRFEESEVYEELNKIKPQRKVSKYALKVLDAPALQNDYYLNLIDWSYSNFIAVGLSNSVYLWNGNNSRVTKLCDVGVHDNVCSVSWNLKNPTLAIGNSSGEIKIWDVEKLKKVRTINCHSNRVSVLSWSSNTLASGSRDKTIVLNDIRSSNSSYRKLTEHKQQVCGLKWSPDEQQLGSGGNDNKLFVWSNQSSSPVCKFFDHEAAVKALAWSPHHHGVLVSGGGTADRTIKFRNTLTGVTDKSIKVNSQVCNLAFSKSLNQLVSTHGYSQNQINLWSCPKMIKFAKLTGHTYRVLYLSMSPDGSTIVTGAGDQTLRFWNVFPASNQGVKKYESTISLDSHVLR